MGSRLVKSGLTQPSTLAFIKLYNALIDARVRRPDVLNATLGNLTELVIAITALQAGQYLLVKASIAGAIVTNTLFMLGGSFLIGGLKHHEQQFNRVSARLQSGLLFLATVALLTTSFSAAAKDRLDLSVGVALGSASQIALFVAPVLVILSYFIGPAPMNLHFWPGAIVMILIATMAATLMTNGGSSAWFVGVMILMVFAIFALTLFPLVGSSGTSTALFHNRSWEVVVPRRLLFAAPVPFFRYSYSVVVSPPRKSVKREKFVRKLHIVR